MASALVMIVAGRRDRGRHRDDAAYRDSKDGTAAAPAVVLPAFPSPWPSPW
jgi:hypothetical protein